MIDIEKLSNSVPAGAGYLGQDGLLHCEKCGGLLQTKITVPLVGERIVNCICECMAAELNAHEEQKRQEEERKAEEERRKVEEERRKAKEEREKRNEYFRQSAIAAAIEKRKSQQD